MYVLGQGDGVARGIARVATLRSNLPTIEFFYHVSNLPTIESFIMSPIYSINPLILLGKIIILFA